MTERALGSLVVGAFLGLATFTQLLLAFYGLLARYLQVGGAAIQPPCVERRVSALAPSAWPLGIAVDDGLETATVKYGNAAVLFSARWLPRVAARPSPACPPACLPAYKCPPAATTTSLL